MKLTLPTIALLSALLLSLAGCSDGEGPLTTDMQEDFTHDHQHQHGTGDGHEHEHDNDFEGSHSHGHQHGHRHGKPLHGGRVLSVGHTHHKGGATHFHVELMPMTDDSIRFFLQTEDAHGEAMDCAIEDAEIEALISVRGMEAASKEVRFEAVAGGNGSEFVLQLPEDLVSGKEFSVIVPKLKLGGQRQNFSFKISREADSGTQADVPAVTEPTEGDGVKASEAPAADADSQPSSEESADSE
ncbi:MAG: hypothetical protein NXI04_01745 [Planctomycetaceae bacterium]|nr:hypothetical protein [Planctomycetaceae bacterium]